MLPNASTSFRLAHDGALRIGVAGWTDATLTASGVFYPTHVRTPEQRLRYYATLFSLVEVDSSYYALPSRRNAELWVERTPPDFTFNVKAFALMTGHPAEVSRLPKVIQQEIPAASIEGNRTYARNLPDEIVDSIWAHFVDALQPLHNSGKLGSILLQYPPWVPASRAAAQELRKTRRRLGDLPAAVEFRNPRWLAPALADRTFKLLADNGFTYVCVDEPQGLPSSVPPVTAVTNPQLAMVRLHGRRADVWQKPGVSVAERFRYLYNTGELAEWAQRVREVAEKATVTHVVFNNCYAN
jgi:uncharacterized protein YecE (DUF72 family)